MSGRRRIDRILDPSYLADAATIDATQLRGRLKDCEAEESELSLRRRWLQGKLDILRAEVARRGDPDQTSVVDRLASILQDDAPRSQRGARARLTVDIPLDTRRALDRLVSATHLAHLTELEAAEIDELVGRIADEEASLSTQRRGLLTAIDTLQHELVRRYKDGSTSAADVLRHQKG